MSDDVRRFRFDQLDQSGVLLGLGGLQLASLGAGLVTASLVLTLGLPTPLAAVPAVLGLVAAFGRIGGRPATEWGPVVLGWVVAGRTRGRRWFAPLPWTSDGGLVEPLELPPPLAGLELVEVDSPWHRIGGVGLVHDTVDQTLTVVLPVRGRDFALLERPEQVDLLTRWGEVLATFARERGLVTRLTWTEFAAPVGLDEHRRWLTRDGSGGEHEPHADDGDEDEPGGTAAWDRSYTEMVDGARALTAEHQVLIALTVARGRLRPNRHRRNDAGDPLAEACIGAAETLLRGLRNAGLEPGVPLSPVEVAAELRWRTDPGEMRRRLEGRPDADTTLVDQGQPGPAAMHSEWGYVRTDGAHHRCFWIAEWPRLAVHTDWIEPLLTFTCAAERAVTVIHQPVAPSASRRRIDRDSIKLESDAAAKEDKGRRVTAQHRRNQQAVTEREHELVAGFVEFDYLGLITVTAESVEALYDGCDAIEQVAREHGLELRALEGRHDLAWATALPIGLGPGRTVTR